MHICKTYAWVIPILSNWVKLINLVRAYVMAMIRDFLTIVRRGLMMPWKPRKFPQHGPLALEQ